jgi:hypothetical protein
VGCAANLEQEIGRTLGNRSPNPPPGPMALGILDHAVAPASEIAIQRMQSDP